MVPCLPPALKIFRFLLNYVQVFQTGLVHSPENKDLPVAALDTVGVSSFGLNYLDPVNLPAAHLDLLHPVLIEKRVVLFQGL